MGLSRCKDGSGVGQAGKGAAAAGRRCCRRGGRTGEGRRGSCLGQLRAGHGSNHRRAFPASHLKAADLHGGMLLTEAGVKRSFL